MHFLIPVYKSVCELLGTRSVACPPNWCKASCHVGDRLLSLPICKLQLDVSFYYLPWLWCFITEAKLMFLLTRCMYLQMLLSTRKSIIFLAGRFKETPCLLFIISLSLLYFALWLYHTMPFYEICNQLKTHEFFIEMLPLHAHSSSFRCYSNAKLYTYMFKFIYFIHTILQWTLSIMNHSFHISSTAWKFSKKVSYFLTH